MAAITACGPVRNPGTAGAGNEYQTVAINGVLFSNPIGREVGKTLIEESAITSPAIIGKPSAC